MNLRTALVGHPRVLVFDGQALKYTLFERKRKITMTEQERADALAARLGGSQFNLQDAANDFAQRLGSNPSTDFAAGMAQGKETLAQEQPKVPEIEGRERRSLINDSGATDKGPEQKKG